MTLTTATPDWSWWHGKIKNFMNQHLQWAVKHRGKKAKSCIRRVDASKNISLWPSLPLHLMLIWQTWIRLHEGRYLLSATERSRESEREREREKYRKKRIMANIIQGTRKVRTFEIDVSKPNSMSTIYTLLLWYSLSTKQ